MYLMTDRYNEMTILEDIAHEMRLRCDEICRKIYKTITDIDRRALEQLNEEYQRKISAIADAVECMKQVQQFKSFLTEVDFTIKKEGWKPDNNDYDVIELNKKVEERKKELDAELFGRNVPNYVLTKGEQR